MVSYLKKIYPCEQSNYHAYYFFSHENISEITANNKVSAKKVTKFEKNEVNILRCLVKSRFLLNFRATTNITHHLMSHKLFLKTN